MNKKCLILSIIGAPFVIIALALFGLFIGYLIILVGQYSGTLLGILIGIFILFSLIVIASNLYEHCVKYHNEKKKK